MQEAYTIHSQANVNAVIWISSLGPSEQGVTTRILEDLEPFIKAVGANFMRFDPANADELLEILGEIAWAAKFRRLRPIIHIDMHGSKENGLWVAASGEFVSWPELVGKFRNINAETDNNLCLVSLACFGFEIARYCRILELTPFYVMIAPEKEILAGEIERSAMMFYECVFRKENFVEAYDVAFGESVKLFHCERMLYVTAAGYIRDNCQGAGAQRRVEYLVTQARAEGAIRNRSQLRLARKLIRDGIRPSPALLSKWVKIFLGGRKVSFTLTQMLDHIERERRWQASRRRSGTALAT